MESVQLVISRQLFALTRSNSFGISNPTLLIDSLLQVCRDVYTVIQVVKYKTNQLLKTSIWEAQEV